MKKLHPIPLFLAVLAFSPVFGNLFAEEPPPIENGREMLFLKNGEILEGRITKLKRHYAVELPDGEIQIRLIDADFVCRNLMEGFERKRSVIQSGNWREHIELARWCQKHELIEQANAEMAAAEADSPGNPLVAALRRQLEPDREPAAKPEKPKPAEEGIINEELDRMVRGLPPKAMETFTQKVQPILMNNCTAAGCHGPQSTTNFKLIRVSGQSANQRLTQRNLYAALQYIDRDKPEQSKLLTLPASPHGNAKNAVFTPRQAEQYSRMALWVMELGTRDPCDPHEMLADRMSPKNDEDEPLTDEPAAPRLLSREAQKAKPLAAAKKTRVKPGDKALEDEVVPASYQEPPAEFLQPQKTRSGASKRSTKSTTSSETQKREPPAQKIKRGAPLPQNESKDPFDPEIFNRRYHGSDTPPEGEKPSSDANPPENTADRGEK